jgi:hypothetical protein
MTLFVFLSASAWAWIVSAYLFINPYRFGGFLVSFLTAATSAAILRKVTF